jgi:uncharacterized protein YhaN
MPQKNKLQSLLVNLRRQGTRALAALQHEITKKEKELETLKATVTQWRAVMEGQGRAGGFTALSQVRAKGQRRRLDWTAVLAGLPTTFKARDVQQTTSKPMEQVYAGLSRWVKDKKVRKGSGGIYQKSAVASSTQQKKA